MVRPTRRGVAIPFNTFPPTLFLISSLFLEPNSVDQVSYAENSMEYPADDVRLQSRSRRMLFWFALWSVLAHTVMMSSDNNPCCGPPTQSIRLLTQTTAAMNSGSPGGGSYVSSLAKPIFSASVLFTLSFSVRPCGKKMHVSKTLSTTNDRIRFPMHK
ncbi:hypothetical protein TRVL_02643 [Trypanosoma vivax]|nr:hypothetical protein TRVL_02643 [Trypanosoma vivax]